MAQLRISCGDEAIHISLSGGYMLELALVFRCAGAFAWPHHGSLPLKVRKRFDRTMS